MIISKELLSEILGYDVIIMKDNTSLNPSGKNIVYKATDKRGKIGSINIHELAWKCKKWAYGLGYDIKESKNSLVISKLTSTGHERVLTERYKLHGVKSEEIIEECQYILEQKAKS